MRWLACAWLIALLWGLTRTPDAPSRGPMDPAGAVTGAVISSEADEPGGFVRRKLPGGLEVNVPERGTESNLIAFLEDPATSADETTWFDFDRLTFETGSAALRPESKEQLDNIAAILKAYPSVNVKVGGYTDNTGDDAANLKLSQDRASAVERELDAVM